jgi:RIO kinase 1
MSLDDIQDRFDKALQEEGVRLRDADQWKVRADVFDEVTLLALYKLVHKKMISVIGGPISTGKEANVFYGEKGEQPIAIKIYLVRTANFKTMTDYLDGDPRFSHIRRTRKEIIFAWTKKEFSNLSRAKEAGVPVPAPYAFDRNILLMEFLGRDGRAYPQLRSIAMDDPAAIYGQIVSFMQLLFTRARLVHADLSEFNILYDGKAPYIIDMGQAVTPDHPRALQFLVRDIRNINRFFSQYCDVMEDKELFKQIAGDKLRER